MNINWKGKGLRILGVSLALMVLAACVTEPITGRKQLSLISPSQEMQLGVSAFEQMKKETPISRDPKINEMVQRVGKRIAAASRGDLPNAQWEFVVFDSPEANAFCLPGGKVGVYTGILPVTKDEGGLATVIGHEVAHAAAHHGSERMSQAMVLQTTGQLAGVALSSSDSQWGQLFAVAYPAVAQVGVLLPYSRLQESKADHIGLIYMARAGYNPEAAVAFWQRFAEYNQARGASGGSAFLRTHPVDEVRVRQLQELMPQAKAAYKPAQ